MDLKEFGKKPLLGILRGVEADAIEPLTGSVISAGLETIEITMNSKNAAALISKMVKCAGKRLTVGAGTVLNMKSLRSALDAGATFIVTPVLVEDVTTYCAKSHIPVFPGAFTPLEIYNAWNAGASIVKVFPSNFFGPKYFSEIKGPFNDIKLLACGGVTPDNMSDYFAHGADAVAFGASVFRKEWLKGKNFKSITDEVRRYVLKCKK